MFKSSWFYKSSPLDPDYIINPFKINENRDSILHIVDRLLSQQAISFKTTSTMWYTLRVFLGKGKSKPVVDVLFYCRLM